MSQALRKQDFLMQTVDQISDVDVTCVQKKITINIIQCGISVTTSYVKYIAQLLYYVKHAKFSPIYFFIFTTFRFVDLLYTSTLPKKDKIMIFGISKTQIFEKAFVQNTPDYTRNGYKNGDTN